MKITLISPGTFHSFSIRALSSYLKRNGHEVYLIFSPDPRSPLTVKVLDSIAAIARGSGLVGISVMTNWLMRARTITDYLHEHSNMPVLWGGVHPTVRPDECLKYADIICVGEGEEALSELSSRIEKGAPWEDVRNIGFRAGDGIRVNPPRPLIEDLDSLPFLDYDIDGHYIYEAKGIMEVDPKLLKKHQSTTYLIMSSRGCRFRCTYCCNDFYKSMTQTSFKVRMRSIGNIIGELLRIKQEMPYIRMVRFEDDDFLSMSEELVEEFCERYRLEIDIPFTVTGIIPIYVTRKKLACLVASGLKLVRMGIQTGSERTKVEYHRRISNEAIIKSARIINEFRKKMIFPTYDIILDNPWESDEDLLQTIELLSQLPRPFGINPFSLTLYPGTKLYERAKGEGILSNEIKEVYHKDFYLFSPSYLNMIILLFNLFKVPRPILKILTSKGLIKLKIRFPFILAKAMVVLGIIRRGIAHLRVLGLAGLPSFQAIKAKLRERYSKTVFAPRR